MNPHVKSGLTPRLDTGLSSMPGIRHGFFTRQGGVSSGLYESLNTGLGSNDDQALVRENRVRIAAHLGVPGGKLVGVHQVHSPDVVAVSGPHAGERPQADALVTATPGVAIGVLTADCGPVLFADGKAGVIGAAHAGWKGAFTGVLENTVTAMETLGASRENIIAVLGPCISQQNYETGPEFRTRFMEAGQDLARYFAPSSKPDHFMFDLAGYIIDRLTAAGVTARWIGDCTYADEDNFFSYRRTTHRAEPDYGRQMSAIALTA